MTDLSIDYLKSIGAFTGRPVCKQVTWKHNGDELTVDVYVRPLSFQSAVADMQAAFSGSENMAARMFAGRIATCIVNPDGTPMMTVEFIMGKPNAETDEETGIPGELARALWDAVAEVNAAGKVDGLTIEDEIWHELVLSGIGGRTIAEAKESISLSEFRAWAKYRATRGSLNVGMRVEHGFALLAAMYANTHSRDGGFRLIDFAPYHDQPPISLERAMKEWH